MAMKTQAGGYKTDALGPISPHQAALKWALQDRNITAAIPGMRDMGHLRENIAVMGMRLTLADSLILRCYGAAIASCYCHMCGDMRKDLPEGGCDQHDQPQPHVCGSLPEPGACPRHL